MQNAGPEPPERTYDIRIRMCSDRPLLPGEVGFFCAAFYIARRLFQLAMGWLFIGGEVNQIDRSGQGTATFNRWRRQGRAVRLPAPATKTCNVCAFDTIYDCKTA